MGYTHYWTRPAGIEIPKDVWQLICQDTRALIVARSDIALRFETDSAQPPLVTDETIRFNGVGGGGHETFLIERAIPRSQRRRGPQATDFAFCKTAQKPYDAIVCGVLAIVQHHYPELDVRSDGTDDDWREPVRSAAEAVGHDLRFLLSKKETA